MFHHEFFEIIKKTIVKHLRATASEFWRLENILVIPGRRYHYYSVLWGFSFWVIAFHGPLDAMKEFICKLFYLRLKELRNSLKVLEIYALLSIWYCYLHNFFPCSFHIILVVEELMVEVNSFDVRRGSLITFLFLLNHKELYD